MFTVAIALRRSAPLRGRREQAVPTINPRRAGKKRVYHSLIVSFIYMCYSASRVAGSATRRDGAVRGPTGHSRHPRHAKSCRYVRISSAARSSRRASASRVSAAAMRAVSARVSRVSVAVTTSTAPTRMNASGCCSPRNSYCHATGSQPTVLPPAVARRKTCAAPPCTAMGRDLRA